MDVSEDFKKNAVTECREPQLNSTKVLHILLNLSYHTHQMTITTTDAYCKKV